MTLEEALAENQALRAQVQQLTELVARLLKENEDLRERLNANSQNSSLPPSKDPPGTLRSPKKSSGKSRGAQPGHPGAQRAKMPPSDSISPTAPLPTICPHCSERLDGEVRELSRQITDVIPAQTRVTEVKQYETICSCCKHRVVTPEPPNIPRGAFGPGVVSLVGTLTGALHLSLREVQWILGELCGIRVSLGQLPRMQSLVSDALGTFHNDAGREVRGSRVLNADDTSWKLNKEHRSLFILTTSDTAYFKIEPNRRHETVRELLRGFEGCLGVDRASTYACYAGRVQNCLAHLDRHFLRIWDRGGVSKSIGARGRNELDRIWALWKRFKSGELTRPELPKLFKPIKARMGKLLRDGIACGHSKTANTCANVLKRFKSMWHFLTEEGVEPTNNSSERGLRSPVRWRRTSFFSQSETGLRFTERILSAVATCKLRNEPVWEFVRNLTARHIGDLPGLAAVPP